MTKSLLTLLLITSLVGAGFLSLVAFNHQMSGVGNECPLATMAPAACSTNFSAWPFHHVALWQLLSQAVLLIITLVLAIRLRGQGGPNFETDATRAGPPRAATRARFGRQKILGWLALFELSPAL